MIRARFEPPSLVELMGRRRDLEQERLRRCLTFAEELELARLVGLIEQQNAPVLAALEQLKS